MQRVVIYEHSDDSVDFAFDRDMAAGVGAGGIAGATWDEFSPAAIIELADSAAMWQDKAAEQRGLMSWHLVAEDAHHFAADVFHGAACEHVRFLWRK